MKKALVEKKYLATFVLITSLFFMWGFAHAILDVLNKHFQEVLEMTKTRSALVQVMLLRAISRWPSLPDCLSAVGDTGLA